jgi:hypothetical protein
LYQKIWQPWSKASQPHCRQHFSAVRFLLVTTSLSSIFILTKPIVPNWRFASKFHRKHLLHINPPLFSIGFHFFIQSSEWKTQTDR